MDRRDARRNGDGAVEDITGDSSDTAGRKSSPATAVLEAAGIPYSIHAVREVDRQLAEPQDSDGQTPARPVDQRRYLKTILAVAGNDILAATFPKKARPDLRAIAGAVGHKSAEFMEPDRVAELLGSEADSVSPLGLPSNVQSVIDVSAMTFPSVLVPSGVAGLDLELTPDQLVNVTMGRTAPIGNY